MTAGGAGACLLGHVCPGRGLPAFGGGRRAAGVAGGGGEGSGAARCGGKKRAGDRCVMEKKTCQKSWNISNPKRGHYAAIPSTNEANGGSQWGPVAAANNSNNAEAAGEVVHGVEATDQHEGQAGLERFCKPTWQPGA